MVKITQLGSDYGVSLGNGSRQALGTWGLRAMEGGDWKGGPQLRSRREL